MVYAHACYLINIADMNKQENYNKSMQALKAELHRSNMLGITGVAFHPGSNANKIEGLSNIASSINAIFDTYAGDTELYIESSAGQGHTLPVFMEDINSIFDQLTKKSKQKVGLVIDTCHVFSAGYDITSKMAIDRFLLDYDAIIGLEKVKLIHLNDSKGRCRSKIDRHETIGKGNIGLENIVYFINHPLVRKIPKILETPVHTYLEWSHELALLNEHIM